MSRGPADKPANMTERQERWFASVVEGMERETGKTIDQWVEIARACPESKPNARKAWFKAEHGIGTNRASIIMSRAFPSTTNWDEPDALRNTLWSDAEAARILTAVEAAVADFPGLVSAQRKGFTAFSKEFQFAALRPTKHGDAMLGLAVDPAVDPRLQPPKREGWSERLKSVVPLASQTDVDDGLKSLLRQAYDRS
jgi:hypothetical protein